MLALILQMARPCLARESESSSQKVEEIDGTTVVLETKGDVSMIADHSNDENQGSLDRDEQATELLLKTFILRHPGR